MNRMKVWAGSISLVLLLAGCGQNSVPAVQGSQSPAPGAQIVDLTGQSIDTVTAQKSITIPVKTASGATLGEVTLNVQFVTTDYGDGPLRSTVFKVTSTVPHYGEVNKVTRVTDSAGKVTDEISDLTSLEAAPATDLSPYVDTLYPQATGRFCATYNVAINWNGPFAYNVSPANDPAIPMSRQAIQLCDSSIATPPALPTTSPAMPKFVTTSKIVDVTSSSAAVNGKVTGILALFTDESGGTKTVVAVTTVRSTVNRYGEALNLNYIDDASGAAVAVPPRFPQTIPRSPRVDRGEVSFTSRSAGQTVTGNKVCARSDGNVNWNGPFVASGPVTDGVTVTQPDIALSVCDTAAPTPTPTPTPTPVDPYAKAKIETSLDKARGGSAALPYAIVTNVPAGTYLRGLVTFERTLDCQADKAKALPNKFSFKTGNNEFTGKVIAGLTFGTQMNSVVRVYDAKDVLRKTFNTTVCYF
ncbi:hypothetical protein [Deinococcus sp. AJ005]|uniref:hypothetical protein n=1 Tax=Deinococcus sp. AJ005 TaxID=2652443 RepID=UPI00125CBA08|nr:hypothetical protein [Deinococcus sp. AJ005]QFP76385.1 hypothetical protein DAAJ005_07895 [Deinococcus sp. AJ005]